MSSFPSRSRYKTGKILSIIFNYHVSPVYIADMRNNKMFGYAEMKWRIEVDCTLVFVSRSDLRPMITVTVGIFRSSLIPT